MQRADRVPLLLILVLPILAALPGLVGFYHADPMLYLGSIASHYRPGIAHGYPYVDPNNAFTGQALGYRAARDWLNGTVPWWNYFSGVGLPLAAEFQPAAFFPATLLLLLPNGMLLQHIVMQILAGLGTYGLLRQLQLQRSAALTGGILFAFCGAIAWFDHAPALPVPFLPWMLWGVERAVVKSRLGVSGGWRMFAVALWLNLVAGFPETAYVNGLLALVWSLLRLCQVPGCRLTFLVRLAIGGAVGIGLSAPQILAFFTFLPHAWLGGHDGTFAHAALDVAATLPSLFFPYIYGPIAAYSPAWDPLGAIWGTMGGYLSIVLVVAGLYGALLRRTPLTWLLLVWVLLVLGKSFNVPGVTALWNLIPGVAQAAFFRYVVPTWELAVIILAAFAVDSLHGERALRAPQRYLAAAIALVLLIIGVLYAVSLRHHLYHVVGLRNAALASVLWGIVSVVVFVVAIVLCRPARAATTIAAVLVIDSVLMFVVPTLSNPRGGDVDMNAIDFLQHNLGLQRIYTLGPIAPNYGAYFGIAAINHNYLPVDRRWVNWVQANLDAYADPISFTGNYRAAGSSVPTSSQELVRNLANYEWIGVKYVLAPARQNPFISVLSSKTDAPSHTPLQMGPGTTVAGTLPAGIATATATIDGVGVLIGNYADASDGMLAVQVCVDSTCANGQRDLKESDDNATFDVPLDHDLQVNATSVVRYRFTHAGGSKPLALWVSDTPQPAQEQHLTGPAGALDGKGLQVELQVRDDAAPLAKPVYQDTLMSIYELAQPKPYFEDLGHGCAITVADREHVTADCPAPSSLLRRELFFDGWTAKVNDAPAAIGEHRGLFQTVALPAGKSSVVFRYEPPHMFWAWLAMLAAFVVLIVPGRLTTMRKMSQRKHP